MKRQILIEIPLLMTADGDNFMIASDNLSIYIQGKTEEGAKKLFHKSAEMLFDKWFQEDRLINQLKANGLIKSDVTQHHHQRSKPKITMPNLKLGHYENMQLSGVC